MKFLRMRKSGKGPCNPPISFFSFEIKIRMTVMILACKYFLDTMAFSFLPASTTRLLFFPTSTKWRLFCLASTTWLCFVPMSTTWLSKLITAGTVKRGCVNLHTPGSHRSTRGWVDWFSDWRSKAIIVFGSDNNKKTKSKACHCLQTVWSLGPADVFPATKLLSQNVNHATQDLKQISHKRNRIRKALATKRFSYQDIILRFTFARTTFTWF